MTLSANEYYNEGNNNNAHVSVLRLTFAPQLTTKQYYFYFSYSITDNDNDNDGGGNSEEGVDVDAEDDHHLRHPSSLAK